MIHSIKFDRNEYDASTRVGIVFEISDLILVESNKNIMKSFSDDLQSFVNHYFMNIKHNTRFREEIENEKVSEFEFRESL